MNGDQIVLVNRTQRDLTFTFDSKHYRLVPGDNYGYVRTQAPYAKAQNPLMGSEDFYSLEYESLVGVKGEDDCTPISDEVLEEVNKTEIERFNRVDSGMRAGVKVVPRHRMPTGRSGGIVSHAGQNAFAIGGA